QYDVISLHITTHLSLVISTAPPTTEIYTLSLHDALPISLQALRPRGGAPDEWRESQMAQRERQAAHNRPAPRDTGQLSGNRNPSDRKSTRLNSSHGSISYAVFCLKKKIKKTYKNMNAKEE